MIPTTYVVPTKIDRGTLLSWVDGDEVLLRELVQLFLVDGPQTIGQLRLGLDTRHGMRVQFAAHTLAGNAGIFGGCRVVELARRLERLGRDNNLAGAEPIVEELDAALDALCRGLTNLLEESPE